MANIAAITGVQIVLNNLKSRRKALAEGTSRGLRRAGLRLQGESQKLVPVEFGVLKASAFTRANGEGLKTVVTVGYTASYAIYVHERVAMSWKGLPREPNPPHKGKYWDPQGRGQAKFLEEPARRMRAELRSIINNETRIAKLL